MTSFLNRISGIFHKQDYHLKELISGSAVAFILKVLAAGISFGFNVILARSLGAAGSGIYFMALSVVTIGAVIGKVGLDNVILRHVAANAAAEEWGAVKDVYQKGMSAALAVSAVVSVAVFFLAPWLSTRVFSSPELAAVMRWMALAVVPLALSLLYAEALKGLKRIRDAISIQSVSVPALSLLCAVILVPRYGVTGAAWSFTLAVSVTCVFACFIWSAATPKTRGIVGRFHAGELLRNATPMFWVSLLQLALSWSSTIMLGIWGTSADVGVFSMALRTATLTSFVLIAVNSVAAPKFAAMHSRGEREALGSLLKNSARLTTLLASPILIIFLAFPGLIMSIFGSRFSADGATALSILAIGQFVNVATGSTGYLLVMTGNERYLRDILALSVVANIILNYLFIKAWGGIGAAAAAAAVMVLINVLSVTAVARVIGVVSVPGMDRVFKKVLMREKSDVRF